MIVISLFILIIIYVYTYTIITIKFSNNKFSNKQVVEKPISILIPFKDESNNLKVIIESINELDYSEFEVIFINDHSEDNSIAIIENLDYSFKYKIYHSKNFGKKKAIELGVDKANYENVVTTDADCVLNPNWLKEINSGLSDNDMLILPIIGCKGNTLQNILSLEQLSLTGTYLALPFFNSGANLAYTKSWFKTINPYKNDEKASGDDVFFLHKTIAQKGKVKTIKSYNSSVETLMPISFRSFISQRLRWFDKSKSFKNKWALVFGTILILVNLAQITTYVLPFYDVNYLNISLIYLSLKVFIDFSFLFLVATRFKQLYLLKYFVFTELLYPFYVLLIPIMSLFIKPSWKGRQL